MMEVNNNNYPFVNAKQSLASKFFGGRKEFKNKFRDFIADESIKTPIRTWVIEGEKGIGKTSFSDWCIDKASELDHIQCIQINMTDCPVKISRETPTPDFYAFLIKRIIKTSRKQKLRLKQRLNRIIFYSWYYCATTIQFFRIRFGPLALTDALMSKILPYNPASFYKKINLLFSFYKKKPSTILFLIDEMTGHDSKSEKVILRMIRSFEESNNINEIKILFILFVHPTWQKNYVRLTIVWDRLKPFQFTEFESYIQERALATRWKCDADFIRCLFVMSGGIPVIFQNIGFKACNYAVKRSEKTVSAEDIVSLIKNDRIPESYAFLEFEMLTEVRKRVIHPLEKKMLILFYFVKELDYDNPNWYKDDFFDGWSYDDWKTKIFSMRGFSEQNHGKIFETVWNLLQSNNIIVDRNGEGLYSFASELLRMQLRTMN